MFNTRNPTDIEARAYEELCRAIEDSRLNLLEHESHIRVSYELPTEIGIGADGTFVLGNKPLRKFAKNAPTRLQAKLSQEDMQRLTRLRGDLSQRQLLASRLLHELRKACDAPHYAQLDGEYNWIEPGGNPPRKLAPSAVEERAEERTEERSAFDVVEQETPAASE